MIKILNTISAHQCCSPSKLRASGKWFGTWLTCTFRQGLRVKIYCFGLYVYQQHYLGCHGAVHLVQFITCSLPVQSTNILKNLKLIYRSGVAFQSIYLSLSF